MQIRIQIRYHLIPVSLVITKKEKKDSKYQWGYGEIRTLVYLVAMQNGTVIAGNSMEIPIKIK